MKNYNNIINLKIMLSSVKIIFKFLLGFGLAVFISGAIYFYFPNLPDSITKTWFYAASLVSGTQIDTPQEENVLPESVPELQEQETQINLENNGENKNVIIAQYNEVLDQDRLDDIADQIDIIRGKINELLVEKNKDVVIEQNIEDEKEEQVEQLDEQSRDEKNVEIKYKNIATGTRVQYPKILISEVQISGKNDNKEEFVELYNPNLEDVDLTDWYLQRKTKTAQDFSTYVSNNLFSGKKIVAKGYFLIARQGVYFPVSVDIFTENPLTEDNSLVLKNPNREISDLLGWGQATDFENNLAESPPNGLSIGRKWQDNFELESDNNFINFEIQNPTPRAQNIKYIPPVGGSEPVQLQPQTAPKLLISEVMLGDNEFIELYNPNLNDVDLADWYLQRKTATAESYSSYVTKTDFNGKKIASNNYFLITRKGSIYERSADIVFDEPLTDGNSLELKDLNGDISDKLGFGFATDFELLSAVTPQDGKALARIWLDSENTEQDTDNNFADFAIKVPTPYAKNIDPLPDFAPPPGDIIGTTTPSDSGGTGIIDTTTPPSDLIIVLPSIKTYTISKEIISPNGDGVDDDTEIDWEFSEEVKVNVDILDSGGVVIYKDFYSSAKVTNPRPKIWNGKNKSGAIVPDGIYTIKVVISSANGTMTDTSKTITVNTAT